MSFSFYRNIDFVFKLAYMSAVLFLRKLMTEIIDFYLEKKYIQ